MMPSNGKGEKNYKQDQDSISPDCKDYIVPVAVFPTLPSESTKLLRIKHHELLLTWKFCGRQTIIFAIFVMKYSQRLHLHESNHSKISIL